MKTISEINWEIQQLSMAIDYYEQAKSSWILDEEKFDRTIRRLNQQIRELERQRCEYN